MHSEECVAAQRVDDGDVGWSHKTRNCNNKKKKRRAHASPILWCAVSLCVCVRRGMHMKYDERPRSHMRLHKTAGATRKDADARKIKDENKYRSSMND